MASEPTDRVSDEGEPISVLIVDDQQVFRDVIAAVVRATPGFRVVGDASSCEDALVAIDELAAEFVIVDVRMPSMNGLEFARVVLGRAQAPVLLLLSAEPLAAPLPSRADGCEVAFVAKEHLRPSILLEVWNVRGPTVRRIRNVRESAL